MTEFQDIVKSILEEGNFLGENENGWSIIRITDDNKYRRKIERIYDNRQKAGKIGYAYDKFFGGV